MNVLKKVLIALFGTVVLIVLISYLLPSKVRVERSTSIHAPPERIYEKVGTLKTWKDWTAWNPTKYPKMEWSYEGPESGVGAVSKWTDPGGNGKLEITKASPQAGIDYDLSFDTMPTVPGTIAFAPNADGTKVTWFFESVAGWNPIERYFYFFCMDSMIGADFETGLAGLKKAVEADPPAEKPMEKPAEEKTEKPAEAGSPAPAPAKQD
jgi:hypothetical protein